MTSRWLLIPAVVAILFRLPVLFSDFVWDATQLIAEHPRLADPAFIGEIFTRDYGLELFGRTAVGYYRPLFMVFNYGLYHVVGPSPFAYHLVALLLFALTSWLVAVVCWRLLPFRSRTFALAVGCLYAAHPARTEVAALLMSLPDLVVETCGLLLLLVMARAVVRGPRPLPVSAAVPGLCFVLGLVAALTKDSALLLLTAIVVSLCLSALARRETRPLAHCAFAILLSVLATLGLVRWAGIERQHSALEYLAALLQDGSTRAVYTVGQAVAELIVPMHPVFMRWTHDPPSSASLTGLILLGLAAGWAIVSSAVRGRWLPAVLWTWVSASMFALMLVRTANLPYSQRYLPLAPALILLAWGVRNLLHWSRERKPALLTRGHERFLAFALAAYIGLHGAFSLAGTLACRSDLRLFQVMAAANPDVAFPHAYLARVYLNRLDDPLAAMPHARRAASIEPDEPQHWRLLRRIDLSIQKKAGRAGAPPAE